MSERAPTETGRLIRAGFTDMDRARALLAHERLVPLLAAASDEDVITDLGGAADPDQALLLLIRILEASDDAGARRLTSSLAADGDLRRRLIEVIGMSEALGEFLERHPGEWQVLADAEKLAEAPSFSRMRLELLAAVGAHPDDPHPRASGHGESVLDALRIGYRRLLLGIASRDIGGLAPMETVARWLADLADAVLDAGVAVARAEVGDDADRCRFSVIGMGKCGARELNYVSDVDVIFVAEPCEGVDEAEALRVATRLATGLMRACNAVTPEGSIWEVDPNLRPEGKQGALVRTVASHEGYYERWAQTWEFQALLKARAVAGDIVLGEAYVDTIRPFRRRRQTEHEVPANPGEHTPITGSVSMMHFVHDHIVEVLFSKSVQSFRT